VKRKDNLVVGLDIGTTKICVVVAEIADNGVNIVGIGSHPSSGLRRGMVVNIDATVDSINKAVSDAELMAGCEISSVYVGIAGGHIKGFNSNGVIAIKGKEITEADLERVKEAASAVAIPMDREVIHSLPQEYIIDGEPGIQNPVGMAGVRLEARMHIVTGAVTSVQNIVKCCHQAGLDVCDIVLEPIASCESVLTPEEREVGTGLIDIGGGTTDLAVFSGNTIRHSFVLALGGNNMTNDISVGLRVPMAEAERIKLDFGTCLAESIPKDQVIELASVGGRKGRRLPRNILAEILEPRVEELFALVNREIEDAGMKEDISSAGIVLTGGASLLQGICEVAESVFQVPVRRGIPHGVSGLVDVVSNPTFATGVGLVLYGAKDEERKKFRIRDSNVFNRIISRMKQWFKEVW